MLKEIWNTRRSQVITAIGVSAFLILGAAVSFVLPSREDSDVKQNKAKREAPSAPAIPKTPSEASPAGAGATAPSIPQDWYVYITGSVRKPGVYQLPPDSRLFQLVDAAGGLDGFADQAAVNLAAPLADGLHIHVPRKGEDRRGDVRAQPRLQNSLAIIPAPTTSSLGFQAASAPAPRAGQKARQRRAGRIDINRALEDELTQLRGIGPSLARRIVEYRQRHGPFRSVEDLVQVRGIGAAKLKGLRDQAVAIP